jgi:hypothetical protein
MRKWGLFTFNWTDRNRSWTLVLFALQPFIRYLFLPPITTFTKVKKECYYGIKIFVYQSDLMWCTWTGIKIETNIENTWICKIWWYLVWVLNKICEQMGYSNTAFRFFKRHPCHKYFPFSKHGNESRLVKYTFRTVYKL